MAAAAAAVRIGRRGRGGVSLVDILGKGGRMLQLLVFNNDVAEDYHIDSPKC